MVTRGLSQFNNQVTIYLLDFETQLPEYANKQMVILKGVIFWSDNVC